MAILSDFRDRNAERLRNPLKQRRRAMLPETKVVRNDATYVP